MLPRVAVTAATLSCGGLEPGSGYTIISLSLQESAFTVQVGFSHVLAATPAITGTAPASGVPIDWSTDHPELVSVTGGTVVGIATGSAHVTAMAGGHTASATVTVVPTVVASVALSRTHATLLAGRVMRVVATPRDSLGRAIAGRAAAFASSDTSVARVGPDGTVTAVATGTAWIEALVDSAGAIMDLAVVDPTPVSFAVLGVAPAGIAPPTGFTLTLRLAGDSVVFSGLAGTPGTLTGSVALADTAEFQADAGAAFVASSLRAAADALPASVPVVLVPRSVALSGGTFAGTVVGINIAAATQTCGIVSSQCVEGNGFYLKYFRSGVVSWESFPITVSMSGFSDADTALIWDALRAMHDAVGRLLFTTQPTANSGFITVTPGRPPGITETFAGYTTWSWDGARRINAAHVWFAVTPGRILVQHEFLHALGFGHTCSWLSPMGGYGCRQVEMSATDVAYLNLARGFFLAESPLRLASGSLPCGYMGLLASANMAPAVVRCIGDDPEPPPFAAPGNGPARSTGMP